MGWWKADAVETTPAPTIAAQSSQPPQTSKIPLNHPPVADSVQQDACPVDHKTREIWLQAAKRQREDAQKQQHQQQQQALQLQQRQQKQQSQEPHQQPITPPTRKHTEPHKSTLSSQATECSSDTISQSPTQPTITVPHGRNHHRTLSQDREISSIPRAAIPGLLPNKDHPSNSESETGTSQSGNWIYPSETQFFNAVMRKSAPEQNTTPEDLASSISSIIPIHNAVNERAWHLIRQWELPYTSHCGGPKLLSFQGLGAGALSPVRNGTRRSRGRSNRSIDMTGLLSGVMGGRWSM